MSSTATGIEWTDATWNPVRGCSKVSEGCRNCYAMHVAARFSGPGQPYAGLAERSPARWTGDVRLIPGELDRPRRWRKPRRVFVNSMSDLFHESLDGPTIARVFAAMQLAPQHTFQVLTKRADRMREILTDRAFVNEVDDVRGAAAGDFVWPLPNVWLGVSVEDQPAARRRVPELIRTPAALRFLSIEPLLARVDLNPAWLHDGVGWIIVGGESGPGARPCDVRWIEYVVRQAREAGVPCFVKQMGRGQQIHTAHGRGHHYYDAGDFAFLGHDPKGGNPAEWPESLRVREFPELRR